MFMVSEADAAAIREAFQRGGELARIMHGPRKMDEKPTYSTH